MRARLTTRRLGRPGVTEGGQGEPTLRLLAAARDLGPAADQACASKAVSDRVRRAWQRASAGADLAPQAAYFR